jgi:hypothetical protein
MDGARVMHEEQRNAYWILVGNLKEKSLFEEQGVDWSLKGNIFLRK